MTTLSCVLNTGEHQSLLHHHQALANAVAGLVQDWPPLRTALQLREGAESCVVAGTPDQKYSHVSLHVNKWFRSGSPSSAKCCAHWGWTKFQSLCWHAVHPLLACSCKFTLCTILHAKPIRQEYSRLLLAHKPSFISRATELCGWQPFQLPQPVVSSAHTGYDLGVPLPRDGCSLLCNLQTPPRCECSSELQGSVPKQGSTMATKSELSWAGLGLFKCSWLVWSKIICNENQWGRPHPPGVQVHEF